VPARASVQTHRSAPSPAEKERALTQTLKSQYIYYVKRRRRKKKSLLNSKKKEIIAQVQASQKRKEA
jgi:hypothetical protein